MVLQHLRAPHNAAPRTSHDVEVRSRNTVTVFYGILFKQYEGEAMVTGQHKVSVCRCKVSDDFKCV